MCKYREQMSLYKYFSKHHYYQKMEVIMIVWSNDSKYVH